MGKSGSGAKQFIEWMTLNIPNCRKAPRYKGASAELTTTSFVEAINNGEIIEATVEEDGSVYGTNIKNLSPDYLYVYNYPLEARDCLRFCPDIELLTVSLYSTEKVMLRRAIDLDWNSYESIEDFIKKVQKSERKDYNLEETQCFISCEHHKIKPKYILQKIKDYNDKYHVLSNLDNFIK